MTRLKPHQRRPLRDGKLQAQATAQGEFGLFAKGPRRFFAGNTPLEIEFTGDTGQPDGLLVGVKAARLFAPAAGQAELELFGHRGPRTADRAGSWPAWRR